MSENGTFGGGEKAEISSISYNSSRREQLEEQLRQAQRMEELGTLTGEIARDFNSILRSVKIYVQMSQEDLPEGHIVQEYLSQTLDGLQQAEDLVGNLLTFVQSENATTQEQVDLTSLVEGVLELVEPSFPESLTLRTQLAETCPVMGDPAQLQQVAMNLIMGAGRSMEDQWNERPTVLEVNAQRVDVDADLAERYLHLEPGRYAHLAVSDTGPGMDPEMQEHIFDPYSEERGEEWSGLGLSVVHGVIEAHDGAITVRTEPGKGSTFNVYLPLAPGARPSRSRSFPGSSPNETEQHILVVDDDKTIRNLETIRLSRLGYDVTTKVNGRDALKAVEDSPEAFDVILIDYRMPEMNGLELVHALRKSGSEAPVVLMTGFGAQVSKAEARVVGVDQLIQKPVESQELTDVLTEIGGAS